MKLNVTKIVLCVIVATILSSLFFYPAFAMTFNSTGVSKESFEQSRREYNQKLTELKEKLNTSEEWAEHQELGDQIESSIYALPRTITEKDRGEIEGIRRVYTEWKDEEAKLLAQYDAPDGLNYLSAVYDIGHVSWFMEDSDGCITKLEQAEAALPKKSATSGPLDSFQSGGVSIVILFIGALWSALYLIQVIMAYGTAYRKTKKNGDNGLSLFGWLIAYNLAAIIPFLGIYLWKKSKEQV